MQRFRYSMWRVAFLRIARTQRVQMGIGIHGFSWVLSVDLGLDLGSGIWDLGFGF